MVLSGFVGSVATTAIWFAWRHEVANNRSLWRKAATLRMVGLLDWINVFWFARKLNLRWVVVFQYFDFFCKDFWVFLLDVTCVLAVMMFLCAHQREASWDSLWQ